jgi:hypothetical protein
MVKKELVQELKTLGVSIKDNHIRKSEILAVLTKIDKANRKREIKAGLKELGISVKDNHIRKADAVAVLNKFSKKSKKSK